MCESNALLVKAQVIEQVSLGDGSFVEMLLDAPRIAEQVKPGQFVHVALPESSQHILRRPLSVLGANRITGLIRLLYQVVGEGTRLLSEVKEEEELSLLGPLGRGWDATKARKCLLIGGGVGAAPLYMLAQSLKDRGISVDVVLGATSADVLVCRESFQQLLKPSRLHLCTDDGSLGYKGFTTELCTQLLQKRKFDYIASCGPEPMQNAVAELAERAGVSCELSLERRMACGIGACLSCMVDTVDGNKRACVDGPVFNAKEVRW